jgi:hypothetical protein
MPRHEYEWQLRVLFPGEGSSSTDVQLVRSEKLYIDSEIRANWYLDDQGEWVRLPDSDGHVTFLCLPDDAAVPTIGWGGDAST